jgi:hypothetical protein
MAAVPPGASLPAPTPVGWPAEAPAWAPPPALAERLFGAELDPEGIQRLVASVMVQVAGRREDGVDDARARQAALHVPSPPPPPAPSAPKPPPVVTGAETVTFPFVLRPEAQSPPLFEFDMENVPLTDGSFDEHLQTAYLLGGSPAVAAVCGGLALQSMRHRKAADEAAAAQTRLLQSRSSDVSGGTTEEMLISPEEVARRAAAAAGLAAVARRYERAEEVCASARTRLEKRVAEARDRFTDAAVRALARRLARSRAELVEQADRYGLKPDDVYTGDNALLARAHLTVIRPQQRQAVRSVKSVLVKLAEARAAATLAERDVTATEVLSPIVDAIAAAVTFGSGAPPFTRPGPGSPQAAAEALRAHAREVRPAAALALARYSAARAVATVAHPAVRLIPDPVPLEGGTVTDEVLAVRLAKSLARVHRSIGVIEARVLGPHGIRDRVYGYPALVLETLRELGLEPTSLEAVMAREVGERRKAVEKALDDVLGWAGMIVPVLVGAVTGGAGAVLAGLLLDVGNVMEAAEKYEVEGAEFASALSALEALGQRDPSRAEIGVAVAFAILGVVL